jgi:hypothetical protein
MKPSQSTVDYLNEKILFVFWSQLCNLQCTQFYGHVKYVHTASFDTIFSQIYMDTPPEVPGVLGVSKYQIFFTNRTVEFLH